MARNPRTMTPVEFEISAKADLDEQECLLNDSRTKHLEALSSADGDYGMDMAARF